MTRLTSASLTAFRKRKAATQKYKCPICKGPLGVKAAQDHDHANGQCRSVLCQSCNVGEGKVLAGLLFRTPKANLAYKDKIVWLKNLIKYLEYWDANPSGIFHPTFDLTTGKQKPVKRRMKNVRAKPRAKPRATNCKS